MPGVLSALLGFSGQPLVIQYLVVAGGGGGGSSGTNYGGGGGAGGYRSSVLGEVTGGGGAREQTINAALGTQYTVTVGAGGGGGANGSNSSIFGIVSTGGGAGRGSAYGAQGFTGGSGGGGTYVNGLGGLRTTNPIQGNLGGVGASAGNPPPQTNAGSGGGGGAGGPGYDLQVPGYFRNSEGSGGLGLQSSITGTATFYAAGGVGSSYYSTSRTNGIGGGATGGVSGGFVSNVGTINTGSGGGGGVNGVGGLGGSGIVILRYPNNYTITIGSGLVGSTQLVGTTEKVTTLTSGTGNVSFAFARSLSSQYLIIGGGGGGGGVIAGGGGAGGLLQGTTSLSVSESYTVTVGAGGLGAFGWNSNPQLGFNGSNSSIFGLTSIGGGGGGAHGGADVRTAGSVGGSGGGAGSSPTGSVGTPGQGFGGGGGDGNHGGGGGGATAVGTSGVSISRGGQGGAGSPSSITGTSVTRAGGGGGGVREGAGRLGGLGGSGGGGNGGTTDIAKTATDGQSNTGGGGGGAGHNGGSANRVGGNGGSGVVILRYPSDFSINFGSGLNASTATSGSDKVTTITAGTGNIAFVEGSASIQSALNLSPHTGLIGQFFSGDFRATISTGNIGTLPLSSPTNYSSISYGTRGDFYGLLAIGYFRPPTTGTYTFFTSSDDGSGVWVGDLASAASGRTAANAVLNNGLGIGQGDTKRSGSVALTGGVWYPIRIVHEEGGGGDNLTFSWSGPGISETTSLSTHFKRPVNLEGTTINTYL